MKLIKQFFKPQCEIQKVSSKVPKGNLKIRMQLRRESTSKVQNSIFEIRFRMNRGSNFRLLQGKTGNQTIKAFDPLLYSDQLG
jgi:hypothetical protein